MPQEVERLVEIHGRLVEQSQRDIGALAGEQGAQGEAELFDRDCEVGRQGMAFAHQQAVGILEVVVFGAAGGEVGFQPGVGLVVQMRGGGGHGGRDGLQMADQDFGQQRMHVREVAADGAGCEAHGVRERAQGERHAAMRGHQRGAGGQDAGFLRELSGGEVGAVGAGQAVGLVAKDAGEEHWAEDRKACLF